MQSDSNLTGRRTQLRGWVLLISTLLLFSCASGPKGGEVWEVAEFEAPSERLFWQVIVEALQQEGFPVGSGLDPVSRTAVTGWRNDLAPFRGDGFRERATVELRPIREGLYEAAVRVEFETNEDLVRPLDLSYADWKSGPDNDAGARLLLQTIRSQLAIGLGP